MRITYLFADFFSADLKFSTAHCKQHWEMFPIMYKASLFAYKLALPCDFVRTWTSLWTSDRNKPDKKYSACRTKSPDEITVSARVNCIIQNSATVNRLTRVTNFASIFKRQFNKKCANGGWSNENHTVNIELRIKNIKGNNKIHRENKRWGYGFRKIY